jgi:hypothetical protein
LPWTAAAMGLGKSLRGVVLFCCHRLSRFLLW